MRQSERRKRNYIIIGLCAVVALMAVGFAAFSTSLNISSSAGITSTWCVGFDSSGGSATPTKGPKTAANPTGSISYTGGTCGSGYKDGAGLSASLYQPGDSVEYTLKIKNASSLDAAINSIMVDNTSVNKNTTVTKGNIKFTVNMPDTTSIASGSSTEMTVVATFQNDEDITHAYSGESQTLSVEINASQDDGNGGFEIYDEKAHGLWANDTKISDNNVDEIMENLGFELETTRCLNNLTYSDVPIDLNHDIIFEETSENAANVLYDTGNGLKVSTFVLPDTNWETGDSIVRCNCTNSFYPSSCQQDYQRSNSINEHGVFLNNVKNPTVLSDGVNVDMQAKLNEILETLDTECIKKLIGEQQVGNW